MNRSAVGRASIRIPFIDRTDAGDQLAESFVAYQGRPDVLVLALPRGGVPVAARVAWALDAPLDILLVRKLGLPAQPERAIGAIATGGAEILNEDVIRSPNVSGGQIGQLIEAERQELERTERLYRGSRSGPDVRSRIVILIDDGLATGATMRAAVAAVRRLGPAKVIVAIPVAPVDTVDTLAHEVDEVVCSVTPAGLTSVGPWYQDFAQITDGQVRSLLGTP